MIYWLFWLKSRFKGAFSFVLNIFRNIYFLIAIPAIIVTYRFMKVLKDQGIIDDFTNTVNQVITSIYYISTNCFPMILNLNQMMACVNGS